MVEVRCIPTLKSKLCQNNAHIKKVVSCQFCSALVKFVKVNTIMNDDTQVCVQWTSNALVVDTCNGHPSTL